jgi:hypothetical protein
MSKVRWVDTRNFVLENKKGGAEDKKGHVQDGVSK